MNNNYFENAFHVRKYYEGKNIVWSTWHIERRYGSQKKFEKH